MAREDSSDEELLRDFLGGDEPSFHVLVRRHEDRIFSVALRIMGDRSDALEAAQETFISLFKQAHSFRGDSALGTWIYSVAVNNCRDLLRKKKRLPAPHEHLPEPAPRGAGLENAAIARIDVSRALAELSDEYREAVAMHDLGGIPYDEIARLTGVAVGTVKSRISRGRRQLANLLEQHPEGATSNPRWTSR